METCEDKENSKKGSSQIKISSNQNVVFQAFQGFNSGGDIYDTYRPSYTDEVVDIIAAEVNASATASSSSVKYHVLELGAGTGKFTEIIATKLHSSIKYLASDPSKNFLDILNQKGIGVDAEVFAARDIPMPDSCVQNIICAECFHWFAEEQDIASIRRVLAPGGKMFLIWNVKDYKKGFMKVFYDQSVEILTKAGLPLTYWVNPMAWRPKLDASGHFKLDVHHTLPGIRFEGGYDKIVGHQMTMSSYNLLSDDERKRYANHLKQTLLTWPGVDPNNIKLPFTTHLYIYRAQ